MKTKVTKFVSVGLIAIIAVLLWLNFGAISTLIYQKRFCPDKNRNFAFFHAYLDNPSAYNKGPYQPYTPFPYLPEEWAELYSIDKNGVVMVHRTVEDDFFYNPVTVSQYAIANFKAYTDTKDEKYKQAFLANAKHLRTHFAAPAKDEISYPYPFQFYELPAGWHSAMAQGQVISALALEYRLTGDPAVKEHVRKVKNFMLKPMEDGGTLATTPEGGPWLEEYASPPPSRLVLNGAVFATVGLYDYLTVNPEDQEARKMYDKIVRTLKDSMDYYDTGHWLVYDRRNADIVDYRYMEFQTLQMYQMYEITGDVFFLDRYKKWKKYFMTCHPPARS